MPAPRGGAHAALFCFAAVGCGLDVDAEPAPSCGADGGVCPGVEDPAPGEGPAFTPTSGTAEPPRAPGAPEAPPPQVDAGQPPAPDVCPPGFTDCNGVCVDLLTDDLNCGRCGVACFPTERCLFGQCCGVDEVLCGNLCTNLLSDESNCGTCGFQCEPGLECVLGVCTPLTPS